MEIPARSDSKKSRTKSATSVNLRLSLVIIGTDETNFPHNILSISRPAPSLCKAFAYNSSKDKKPSKTQLSKLIHSGGFLGRLLGSLEKFVLPLVMNLLQPLGKSTLVPLGLTEASPANTVNHKNY